ncbi:2-C-methyl-D-erythritol 4-phosphate cytidylyltransferase [Tsukamurella sp. 8F]|uniref:2-C-methyl-D-erythritol 4-phosphate cytidylyltransferase n=1 Tax=unclassified Tsukamurella TaxID=2633480 RepID=UPI0023B9D3F4|nr:MULTISPECIES: 2-C-methyl-D-erythritol 4-phosphate cytidylyltransferase [unclassified Tsukamurella]MDF0532188.1 2-C-methyl-D-erythritol 4-phosphate cytidylyltransferase [Tsukamurella sp. 8J]MDF0589249.1 2-C-methyl-D-erythritol 4-phosphate cytidylyltransferase [Tsukamurella sp. 8F]
MSVVALVPAAGQGVRLGGGRPKAFVELLGRTLLDRAVAGLKASGVVDTVVVMAPPDLLVEARREAPGAVVVTGGAERTDSVRCGLEAAGAVDGDLVLVHDAARPLTPVGVIAGVVEALRGGATAVIPVLPVVDTVKRVDGTRVLETVDRTDLRAVQTPQGFVARVLLDAYAVAEGAATDDAGLVERAGGTVTVVPGDARALKITTPFDLAVARALLEGS